jgi:uncharacterized protein (DUF427 family)
MAQASWNGTRLAESDQTIQIEGNHYFPQESVNQACLRPSDHTTVCSWKGTASYCDVVVDGKINAQAAWFYPEPLDGVTEIKGHIAFWKGVKVEG